MSRNEGEKQDANLRGIRYEMGFPRAVMSRAFPDAFRRCGRRRGECSLVLKGFLLRMQAGATARRYNCYLSEERRQHEANG